MDSTSGSAVSRTYVPPGEGPAYWVGNTEFVTLKLTGSETSGAFAVVELVAMPGAEPFVGTGCEGQSEPQPAVTVDAGAIWGQVYDAVTTQAGRYVQGVAA